MNEALSLTVARKLRREGIQFKNLVYNSEHVLEALTRPEAAEEVIIRVDPADLTIVYLMDPDPKSNKWHPCYLRKDLIPRVQGKTLEEYELVRALRKNRLEEVEDDQTWSVTYRELQRSLERASDSKRQATRVSAAGVRGRIIEQARYLTAPKLNAPPSDESLSDTLDRVYEAERPTDTGLTSAPNPTDVPDATPKPASKGGFNPSAWALEVGLELPPGGSNEDI